MKVSLNTIKRYIDVELPATNTLIEKISAQLGKVEDVIELGDRYKDALIVRVISATKHPDADRLTVTRIDDGGVVKDIERDEEGFIQVVCGAPNAKDNIWAVWLPPKSIVPSSFGETEPFVLDSRNLRGVMSHGMLAAADELAIGTDHDGIIELSDSDLPEDIQLSVGLNFAKTFDLDDTIIDIENKMFTHRPDLFGQLGVAREISAIIKGAPQLNADTRFVNPDWYWTNPELESAEGLELVVNNEIPEKVPRFMAVAIDNIEIKPSPFWLQCKLVAMGGKPVNNVVDITNYLMLLTAQPLHAYDYDKLRNYTLGTRLAREGESLTLLNGKTYDLNVEDIVIVDGEGPIGLAGIMGGSDSEVSIDTRRIVLEAATFDMYAIRKSSMRHGLFTDAVTRFNKGQSPLQTDRILAKTISMLTRYCEGNQASEVHDLTDGSDFLSQISLSTELQVSTDFVNKRLGTSLDVHEIGDLLRRVNFAANPIEEDDDTLLITAPFWRTDIEIPEDIVEEVGRLYGFDQLPRVLPTRSMQAVSRNARREIKQKIRDSLSRAGANEVLTYSFVHENIIRRAEQDVTQAFQLTNALSPELQYYRLTVLPSLLDRVHMNIKMGHDEFTLFEIGKGHNKKYHLNDDDGLPKESQFVDAVYASKQPRNGTAYYYVRNLVDQLCRDLGMTVRYMPLDDNLDFPVTAPFDLKRSALIETTKGQFIGMVGELKQSVIRGFKLPDYTAAITLDLEGLQIGNEGAEQSYKPLSRFPSLTQDISIRVSRAVRYDELFNLVKQSVSGDDIAVKLEPLTIYQPQDDNMTKTITLRLTITSYLRTLTDSDVAVYLDAATNAVKTSFDGERV